jgi:hypothetical protein
MKKILLASAALLAVTAPLAAYAAPPKHKAKAHAAETVKASSKEFTTGTVAAYAPDTRMLKLSTGNEFKLAPSITNTTYKAGDKVTVRWQMKDGSRLADEVTLK